ncbi:hypothetical protein J7355_12620 [Endozoicomonas sp. G2_2]|uniref:DUF5666 domain-containing protein n=1 Tax=Endozoicomonas sp. G2_2 TaxID=2821092 RepID=UPI001ADC4A75|nr:DUF5666 domain-containing protein [Endozoicomonas sp. G2_2]MBO9470944.1 hypothetical protein [Endozoicomonas sp. G2_2]
MRRSHTAKRWLSGFSITLGTAALVACGSGGGDDGRTAGIEGTGIVSGFGSVYVDGIEFETTNAEILFVGDIVDESALSVGDIVSVSGTVDNDDRASARRIVFERTLDGPVESIEMNGERGELVALEQTVRFDEDTTFVNLSADALNPGDLIAVSGFVIDSNLFHAESIRRNDDGFVPNGSRLEIEGDIDTVDGTQLTVGNQLIRFDNARVSPNRTALRAGQAIEAFGSRGADRGDPLIADEINVLDVKTTEDGRRMFVEAAIRDYNGLDNFIAGGWRIDARDAERVDDGALGLGPGVMVSVRGTFDNGRIQASTLEAETPSSATIQGPIDTVDADNDRISLLGVTVDVPPDTRYRPLRAAASGTSGDRSLRIDDLAVGDIVRLDIFDSGERLTARALQRARSDDGIDAALIGPVERVVGAAPNPTVVIAGITARTQTGRTLYYGANGEKINATAFAARATRGQRVTITGPANGGEINTATRVQLID